MKTNFGSFCAVAAFALTVAMAPAHADNFKGAYGGIEGGIGIVNTDGATLMGPFSEKDTSGYAGGVLGYRSPVGNNSNFVLGLEGTIGLYTNGSDARYGVYGIGGFRVGDNGLAYVRVGYAWLDGVDTGIGKGIDGLALGGGYELGITENMNLRLDYRYIDYGGVDIPDNVLDFDGHEVTVGVLFDF